MSQHDLSIANQGFPAFRSDLNDALQALGSLNSGATAPSTTYANMLWYDTANNILKIRNEDNDAWISIATLDQSTDTLVAIGSVTLSNIAQLTGNQSFDSGTLYIDASNNRIGVGTTTPARLLHISGGASTTYLQLSNDSSGNTNADGFQIAQDGSNVNIINRESGYITLDTSNSERVRIDSSGNIGVGRTPTAVAAYKMFEIDGVTGSYNKHFVNGSERSYWYTANAEVGFGTKTAVPLLFTTNDIERIRIPSDAGGITFPSTQVASSNANTLDDYEEGTWTPTITGSSSNPTITYTVQRGDYVKVGGVVTVHCQVAWSANSGGSGYTRISGLPFFPVSQSGMGWYSGCVSETSIGINWQTGYTQIGIEASVGNGFVAITTLGSQKDQGTLSPSYLGSAGYFVFSLTYRAS